MNSIFHFCKSFRIHTRTIALRKSLKIRIYVSSTGNFLILQVMNYDFDYFLFEYHEYCGGKWRKKMQM